MLSGNPSDTWISQLYFQSARQLYTTPKVTPVRESSFETSMAYTLVVVVVLSLLSMTDASCTRRTDQKHFVSHIEFETGDINVGCFLDSERLEIGETKTDYIRCRKCECLFDGLECCGFGTMGGAVDIEIPDGCKIVEQNCVRKLVRVDNEAKLCGVHQS